MQKLQVLIDHLEHGRNLHISILDFSGILSSSLTEIRFDHVIHSKKICDVAKSTAQGYRLCLQCKSMANSTAVTEKKPFCGQCAYGLYEAAVPVVIEQSVMAIVYVGNAIVDRQGAQKRIEKACRYTGVSEEKLLHLLGECETLNSEADLFEIGEIVADYLKMLYDAAPIFKTDQHWLISLMKKYAKEHTEGTISLREFAVSHQKNAQYIGRLFQQVTGMSFSQYCNEVRLKKAAACLVHGNEKIIDVAFGCGFPNVSYFNRCFFEKYGMTPTEYRRKNSAV